MIRFGKGAAAALAFGALSLAAQGAGSRVHVIEIDKLAFGPAPDGLHVNDAVEWKNSDIFQHTATASDGSFDIDLPSGASGRTILTRAGVVYYVCRYHPRMTGRLEIAP
jgi:plastocyanin